MCTGRRRRWNVFFKRKDKHRSLTIKKERSARSMRRVHRQLLFWLPRGRWASLLCGAAAFFAAGCLAIHGVSAVMAGGEQLQEPVCRVETAEKQIALSFDVEWTDVQTQTLLGILEGHEAKATFFVVGRWAKAHPESVLKMVTAGNEVGSHSMAHTHLQKCSDAEQRTDLQQCSEAVEQITGTRPRLFRAPYTTYSPELLAAARDEGMVSIAYDVDSLDWKNLPPERICTRVVQQVRPGSIVRFQSSALNTPTALSMLLTRLQKEGYTFVTVSALIDMEHR